MHRSCSVAHGTAKQRAKIIAAGAEFVAINFDGLAVVEDEIIAGGFDLIVVDEANAYKNPAGRCSTASSTQPTHACGCLLVPQQHRALWTPTA